MNKPMPPTPLRQEDYLAIEAAVMETARGRWFLAEYARRNRNSDTDTLLAAIDKLEKTVVKERAPSSLMHRVKMDLADMAAAIEKTKQEIAQIKHEDNDGSERFERASSELDAIVSQTETATGDILGAAEKIQEFAWTLREQGADEANCDALDVEATNIYMACSFQDLTGQRIKKIVDAMRYVESRINTMINIWGFESHEVEVDAEHHKSADERPDAHLLNGPALEGEGIEQNDVDSLMNHSHENGESNQDDVDALFDVSPAEDLTADADFSNDFDFDAIDTSDDDTEILELAAEPVAEAETVSAEPVAEADAVVAASEVDADDVAFVEMDELGWAGDASGEVTADASAELAEPEVEIDMAASDAADVFASAEVSEHVDDAVDVAADVFASSNESVEIDSASAISIDSAVELEDEPDADIFAASTPVVEDKAFMAVEAAMQDHMEDEYEDLRDRVADFS